MKEKEKRTATGQTKLAKKAESDMPAPFFVEAEKMFEKFADISRETAHRAFDFFRLRGGEFGHELDDWFRAESDVLHFVPIEIKEENGSLKVTADVAGFRPEEIEIGVEGNSLMISGRSEARSQNKDENILYTDFRSNRFFRQMPLPKPVNADGAKADIKDGMLNILLPKAKPEAGVKKIAVSAG